MSAAQLALLDRADAAEPRVDSGFGELARHRLGNGAWVDHVPRWLRAQAWVFARLHARAEWKAMRRRMYERNVDVPRLMAKLPPCGGHPVLQQVQRLLAQRYGEPFESVSLALYRDGRDSVAWHADKGLRDQPESTLALLSLGEPRPFRLRPIDGGATRQFQCGWGDLLVLGGTVQRHWLHSVPKVRTAGPRIVVMYRRGGVSDRRA